MGAYVAEIIAGRKYKGLGVTKEERIKPVGSLITLILKYCRVHMSDEAIDKKKGRIYIDDTYLVNARICRHKIYQWLAPRGVTKYCKLPKTDWAVLRTWEQVRFELPDREQCRADGTPLVDAAEPEPEYHAPPPTAGASTFTAAGQFCEHGTPLPAPDGAIAC